MCVKITLACTECKQRNYNMTKEKKNWFKGLKAEFRKIIWVDNKTLGKQTVAVVAISAVTCGLITLVDSAVIEFVNLLIK